MSDADHPQVDGSAKRWEEEVTEALVERRYIDALSQLVSEAVRSAIEALKEVIGDFDIEVRGRDQGEMFAQLVFAAAQLAEEQLANAEALGHERIDMLAAATYTLRHCGNYLHALRQKVPGPEGFAEYRARLLITGWIAGEAYAGLSLSRGGVFHKAVRWEWEDKRKREGRERGNKVKATQSDRWKQGLLAFAKDYLSKFSEAPNSDIIEAAIRGGHRLKTSAAAKALSAWRADGELPLSPAQRRKVDPNSGVR